MKKSLIGTIAVVGSVTAMLIGSVAVAQAKGGMGGQQERPTFETLDADSDGNITIAEMKAHSEAQFGERDTDGNGVLSAEELVAGAAAKAAERATTRVEQMIEWRDTDGDGALSASELGGDNGQRMFAMADENEDGMISSEEFDAVKEKGKRGKRMGRDGDHGGKGKHGGKGDKRRGG